MGKESRLLYIDNLRWVMISLVVIMHLKVTYSSQGSWYYMEERVLDAFSYVLFGVYGSFVQAFFMGLLFFLAGYFVPASFDRKGAGRFTRDRMVRLGIPALFYMLLLNPLTLIIIFYFDQNILPDPVWSYTKYIFSLNFLTGSGPLWFALALLIFSCGYSLYKLGRQERPAAKARDFRPTNTGVIFLIAAISILAFILRIFYPVGESVLNMQIGDFSQYIILFILGTFAYRRDLLHAITTRFGKFWLKLALFIGVPAWFTLMLLGGVLTDSAPFLGGLTWQSAGYCLWESFFCVGVSLGLIVLFRERYNFQGSLSQFLSRNAFGVYVFHPPIIVAISMFFQGAIIYPLLKMAMVSVVALPLCFIFVALIRKIPAMERLFS